MIFKLDTFSNLWKVEKTFFVGGFLHFKTTIKDKKIIPVNSFPKNIDFEIKILPDRVHNISRLDLEPI